MKTRARTYARENLNRYRLAEGVFFTVFYDALPRQCGSERQVKHQQAPTGGSMVAGVAGLITT